MWDRDGEAKQARRSSRRSGSCDISGRSFERHRGLYVKAQMAESNEYRASFGQANSTGAWRATSCSAAAPHRSQRRSYRYSVPSAAEGLEPPRRSTDFPFYLPPPAVAVRGGSQLRS